ncbi:hypothetical protein [Streptomyces sp. NPDC059819]|uniref:hypothetical protein n=1 Tax=Streptomyces sp. NPDC059819 TaxID=3346963 RepID=UPI00365C2045
MTALHRAAAESRRTAAALWTMLAWEPPDGELGYRGSVCQPLLVLMIAGPG